MPKSKKDESLTEGLKALQVYYEEHGHANVPHTYKMPDGVNLGAWAARLRRNKSALSKHFIGKINKLNFDWTPQKTALETGIRHLKAYKKQYGHCEVHADYVTQDGYRLGAWVSQKRTKKIKLPAELVDRLDRMGFIWDKHEQLWNALFEELKVYHQEHGDTNVPTDYITESGAKLGYWVRTTRRSMKEGTISPARAKRLKDLILTDAATSSKRVYSREAKMSTDEYYELLRIYADEHGHANAPLNYRTPDGINLGFWVSGIRRKRRKSALSKNFIGKINKLNFDWNPKKTALEAGIRHLRAYKKQYGSCDVPCDHVTQDGYQLGSWVTHKRSNKDKLPEELVERLDQVGFIWSKYEISWNALFDELKAYTQEHGDSRILCDYTTKSGIRLGDWVANQRNKMRDGSISPARAKRLKGLVSDNWHHADLWDTNYSALIKYKKKFGNVHPPKRYITMDGIALGEWVSKQRGKKKRNQLSADRIKRLDDIGFVWG